MVKSFLRPKIRVFLFLSLFNLAWMVATWLWVEQPQWLWITPIALSINFLLMTYDHILLLPSFAYTAVAGQDPYGLLKIVHRLNQQFALPDAEILIVQHPTAQVFAYGRSPGRTRVFVSQGALDLLTPGELEAVLTFQWVARQSRLTELNYWLGAMTDLWLRFGRAIEGVFRFIFGWAPPLAATLTRPWLALAQVMLLGPGDFQKLDQQTTQHLTHPEDLARALWKMDSYAHTKPWTNSWAVAHMCMVSPITGGSFWRGPSLQPPLKSRIKRLVGRYPL